MTPRSAYLRPEEGGAREWCDWPIQSGGPGGRWLDDVPARFRPQPTPPRPERGASLVGYALLLALVAIVCIGGVTLIGRATMDPLSSAASMFGG